MVALFEALHRASGGRAGGELPDLAVVAGGGIGGGGGGAGIGMLLMSTTTAAVTKSREIPYLLAVAAKPTCWWRSRWCKPSRPCWPPSWSSGGSCGCCSAPGACRPRTPRSPDSASSSCMTQRASGATPGCRARLHERLQESHGYEGIEGRSKCKGR